MTASGLADHPLAESFHALSPDKVLDAVEVDGRRCTGRFLTLNSYENRVYQLELEAEDGPRGEWVVAKFYRPGRWRREAILAEHAFLRELAAEGLPVAPPLDEALRDVGGILYAVFPRVGGRAPDEPSDEQLRTLGRLLARLHNVGATAPAPDRPRLTPGTYGRDNLRWLLENDVLPAEVRPQYEATVGALLDRIEPLFRDVPALRIHGDCHVGNVVWPAGAGPTFLDFDDFLNGPAVQDVWMLVPSADAEGARQRAVLVEAYRELRDLDPAWMRLVEPLRALRFIHYATWIARRIADPTFARTFNHFGSLQYWQREVQDLREQIARVDAL